MYYIHTVVVIEETTNEYTVRSHTEQQERYIPDNTTTTGFPKFNEKKEGGGVSSSALSRFIQEEKNDTRHTRSKSLAIYCKRYLKMYSQICLNAKKSEIFPRIKKDATDAMKTRYGYLCIDVI